MGRRGGRVQESNNLPEKPGPFLPTGEEGQTENCILEMGAGGSPHFQVLCMKKRAGVWHCNNFTEAKLLAPGSFRGQSVASQVWPAHSTDTGVPPPLELHKQQNTSGKGGKSKEELSFGEESKIHL